MLSQVIRSIMSGFFMGTADLVPGVSGGTIALVLRIYERLVASIREGSSALGSILKGDVSGFRRHLGRVEWSFLIPLLSGILLAVVVLAGYLETQLEDRPTVIAGLFFGLVAATVVIAWAMLKRPVVGHLAITAVVGVALFLLLGLGEGETAPDPSLPAFFGAGALAICAMILPGISGSLILLMLGMYSTVLGAVTNRDLLTIGVFVLGAIVGLAVFSQFLHWALENHHDNMLAGLIGLMAGSTRVLWPWPDGVDSPELGAPGEDWLLVSIAAAIGIVAVLLISRMASHSEGGG